MEKLEKVIGERNSSVISSGVGSGFGSDRYTTSNDARYSNVLVSDANSIKAKKNYSIDDAVAGGDVSKVASGSSKVKGTLHEHHKFSDQVQQIDPADMGNNSQQVQQEASNLLDQISNIFGMSGPPNPPNSNNNPAAGTLVPMGGGPKQQLAQQLQDFQNRGQALRELDAQNRAAGKVMSETHTQRVPQKNGYDLDESSRLDLNDSNQNGVLDSSIARDVVVGNAVHTHHNVLKHDSSDSFSGQEFSTNENFNLNNRPNGFLNNAPTGPKPLNFESSGPNNAPGQYSEMLPGFSNNKGVMVMQEKLNQNNIDGESGPTAAQASALLQLQQRNMQVENMYGGLLLGGTNNDTASVSKTQSNKRSSMAEAAAHNMGSSSDTGHESGGSNPGSAADLLSFQGDDQYISNMQGGDESESDIRIMNSFLNHHDERDQELLNAAKFGNGTVPSLQLPANYDDFDHNNDGFFLGNDELERLIEELNRESPRSLVHPRGSSPGRISNVKFAGVEVDWLSHDVHTMPLSAAIAMQKANRQSLAEKNPFASASSAARSSINIISSTEQKILAPEFTVNVPRGSILNDSKAGSVSDMIKAVAQQRKSLNQALTTNGPENSLIIPNPARKSDMELPPALLDNDKFVPNVTPGFTTTSESLPNLQKPFGSSSPINNNRTTTLSSDSNFVISPGPVTVGPGPGEPIPLADGSQPVPGKFVRKSSRGNFWR